MDVNCALFLAYMPREVEMKTIRPLVKSAKNEIRNILSAFFCMIAKLTYPTSAIIMPIAAQMMPATQ